MLKKRKFVVLAAATAILTLGAGIAFAAWTATGEGTGRATAMNASVVTVNAASGAPDLYPGFDAGDLYFTLDNPNPYPVTFTAMVPGPDGIVSSDEDNCPGSENVTIVATSNFTVAGDADSTTAASIPDVVSMDDEAPDGCQNQTFDISVVLTGMQGQEVA